MPTPIRKYRPVPIRRDRAHWDHFFGHDVDDDDPNQPDQDPADELRILVWTEESGFHWITDLNTFNNSN